MCLMTVTTVPFTTVTLKEITLQMPLKVTVVLCTLSETVPQSLILNSSTTMLQMVVQYLPTAIQVILILQKLNLKATGLQLMVVQSKSPVQGLF